MSKYVMGGQIKILLVEIKGEKINKNYVAEVQANINGIVIEVPSEDFTIVFPTEHIKKIMNGLKELEVRPCH